MNTNLLTRTDILHMIEAKKMTAEEGLQLLKAAQPESANRPSTVKTYSFRWDKRILQADFAPEPASCLLIFGSDEQLRDRIADISGIEPSRAIFVGPGRAYRQADERTYFINPSDEQHYQLLMDSLAGCGKVPSFVVHYWSQEAWRPEAEVMDRQLEYGFYSVLNTSKSLMLLKARQKVSLLYLYDGKYGAQPLHGAVSGLANAVGRENIGYRYRTIDLGGDTGTESLARMVLREWGDTDDPAEVRYEQGVRYTKRYEEVTWPASRETQTGFRAGGTYLITGGTGGIGMIFARYLARNYQARLILAGSSPLDESKTGFTAELGHLGGEAVYIQANLAHRAAAAKLMAEARNRFGVIDGILHAAGATRDALLIGKDKEDAARVLAPKVHGTVFLAEEMKREAPAFILLFSGLAAIAGNAGQTDYAYANAFLDQYAPLLQEELPRTKVVSVNWPLWENGGMQLEADRKEQLLQSAGIAALGDEEGIEMAIRALRSPFAQLAVVPVNGEGSAFSGLFRTRGTAASVGMAGGGQAAAEGYEAIESYIKGIVSRQLKLAPSRIQPGEPLEKYGIDSMSIVRMTNEMERDFGELSKTLFFEYQTVEELAAYFMDHHADSVISKLTVKAPAEPATSRTVAETVTQTKAQPAGRGRFRSSAAGVPAPAVQASLPESARGETVRPQKAGSADIAIIGISGRYPLAHNLDDYWDNLAAGRDCITEIPPERWDYNEHYAPERGHKDKIYSKWGGFIDGHDRFDPLFFGITPRDAELMDPQERLFLEVVWQAIEDAGYNAASLRAYEVGVYAGVMYGHYQLFGAEETVRGRMTSLSSSYASIANRISYALDFRGPSLAVDSMCSSSLSTVHLACESIRSGECQVAVAGGVNLSIHPTKYHYLCTNNFASGDGRCRSFGEGGSGYVPGEGVGAIILKPVSRAEADGDHIYAVIKSSAINHDGRTNGYTVPSPVRQSELIAKALKKADIDPRSISYIEAHGTGTALGDPIEITGLTKAFAPFTADKQFCPIGSVKSNIGHLEAAAGIAGITKIVLQMKYGQLVPSIHSDTVNANIKLEQTPFYIQRKLEEWKRPTVRIDGKDTTVPRMAGISAFGAGGSNAHLILSEYVDIRPAASRDNGGPKLIVLSARTKEQLIRYAERLSRYIQKEQDRHTAGSGGRHGQLQWIQARIRQWVSDLIQVDAKEVDADSTLSEMNLDVQTIFALIQRINAAWNTGLELKDGWNGTSIRGLASGLCQQYGANMAEAYARNREASELPERPDAAIDLAAVAYTLQTGREEKGERLAVVVSDVAELQQDLERFCRGEDEHPRLIAGSIRDGAADAGREADSGQIRDLIRSGAYRELAALWVSGADIDWNMLYADGNPRRLPLPTYPFDSKRYWYNSHNAQGDQKKEKSALTAKASAAGIDAKPPASGLYMPETKQVPQPAESAYSGFAAPLQLEEAAGTYTGNEVNLRIVDDSIAVVTMQDKRNRNMFDRELVTGLMAAFWQIEGNKRIKAVILTGCDNIFSMGGTQGQLLDIADQKRSFTDAPFLYRGLLECPVPVIAAIQGHASGGGLLFGLYADMVVMAEEGIYSAVFMKYGFTPGMGATYVLKEKLGHNLAVEMMHTAASFTGAELAQRGASVTFKPSGDVMKEALRIARSLAEKPLAALQTLKVELSGRILQELPAYIERERRMHELTFTKPEVKERIQHFYLDDHTFDGKAQDGNGETPFKPSDTAKPAKLKLKSRQDIAPVKERTSHEAAAAAESAAGPAGELDALLEALMAGDISPEEAMRQRSGNGGY